MDIMHERCCDIDVHKKTVVACAITSQGKDIRTFDTMTDDLVAMAQWSKSLGCAHVAMESTASFRTALSRIGNSGNCGN